MKRFVAIRASVALASVLLAVGTGTPVLAVSPTCVYVRETGHNVHGAFLAFYLSRSGVENFGVPLTEAFIEDGIIVQYFTRARLELHPDSPEPLRVQAGLLGMQYGVIDPPMRSAAIPPANNTNFRYFPDTGQMVALTIKEYFDRHGGVDVFGYPVSMLKYEAGIFVQYFQRGRLEWNPTGVGPNKVRPSPVGQIALERRYPPNFQWRVRAVNDWCAEVGSNNWPRATPAPSLSSSEATPVPQNAGLNLQVRVRYRQTGLRGPQFVDVFIDDLKSKPLAGVALYAIVHFANADRVFPLMPTDKSGKSSFCFDIGNQPANSTTLVEVFAQTGPLRASARDSFTR